MDALERLRALTPRSRFCEDVGHVVCVMASSRGGSSVSMEMFRHSRSLLHFRGEVNPFLAMAGLVYPDSGTGSDALNAVHATEEVREIVGGAMGREAGQPAPWPDDEPGRAALAQDVLWRLTAQWPEVALSPESVTEAVDHALTRVSAGQRAAPHEIEAFQLSLCRSLRGINPWFYDVDPSAIQSALPDISAPIGAPSARIVEEPPFVLHQAWRRASPDQVASLPLMMKTPSNAYRMDFLRALFPNARVQVLHLTRNPAAAINGLVDGWRFRGFHAHRLGSPHDIQGAPERDWWKYDLPPGWEAWTNRSLVEVAGFQWRSAHTHILKTRGEDALQVRFEDLTGAARMKTFEAIFAWMGADLDAPMRDVITAGLPPVMATERPRQRRWFARADLLEPVLADPDIQRTAEALGYTDRADWV